MKQVSEKADSQNHDIKRKEAKRTSAALNGKSGEKGNRKSNQSPDSTNRDPDETIRKIALMLEKDDESSRISSAVKSLSSNEKDALKKFLSGGMNDPLTEKQESGHDEGAQTVHDMSSLILQALQSVTSITGSGNSDADTVSGNGASSYGEVETLSGRIYRDMQSEVAGISVDGGQLQSRKGEDDNISAMKHLVMEALEHIQQHVNEGAGNSQLVSSGRLDMNQIENAIRQTLSTISTRGGNPSSNSASLDIEDSRMGGGSHGQGDDTVNVLGEAGQGEAVSGNKSILATLKGEAGSESFEGETRGDNADDEPQDAGQGNYVSPLLRNDIGSSLQGVFRGHLDVEAQNHESVGTSANARESDAEKIMGRNDNVETVASSRSMSMTVNTHDRQPVHVNLMRDTSLNGVDRNIVTLQATDEHVTQALHKSRQVLEGGFRDMGVDPASLSIEIRATDTGQSSSGEHHGNGEQLAGQMQNQSPFMQNSFSGGGGNGKSSYTGSYRDGSVLDSSSVNDTLSGTGDIAPLSGTAPSPGYHARKGLNISV